MQALTDLIADLEAPVRPRNQSMRNPHRNAPAPSAEVKMAERKSRFGVFLGFIS